MATRSRIGIENENGTVATIYCHWDGSPSSNGKILKENYRDEESVRKLLSLGDLSELRETPETCVAYHRDRGEPLKYPRIDQNLDLFRQSDYQEFGYIFNLNKDWQIFQ